LKQNQYSSEILRGFSLEKILEPINLSVEQFTNICDRFTNKKLFKTDTRGNLVKDRHGNLTKILQPDDTPVLPTHKEQSHGSCHRL